MTNEEVNYMEKQQRRESSQGNHGYQLGNNTNYDQGWRQVTGPLSKHNPCHNFN